jgi:hypothetical protein
MQRIYCSDRTDLMGIEGGMANNFFSSEFDLICWPRVFSSEFDLNGGKVPVLMKYTV